MYFLAALDTSAMKYPTYRVAGVQEHDALDLYQAAEDSSAFGTGHSIIIYFRHDSSRQDHKFIFGSFSGQ
jgi:hypothetical protein